MPQLNTHDLILRLKEIKEEHSLTIQTIFDMTEASGSHVSLNSIKRIFADGSENEHFRSPDTLQPVARILLGIYGNKQNQEISVLQAEIREKDNLIAHLKQQIEVKDARIDRLFNQTDDLIAKLQKLLNRCEGCRMGAGEWHTISGKTDYMRQSE